MKPLHIIWMFTLLAGCEGVTFKDAPKNTPLPPAMRDLAIYPAGVAGYDFQDLVGNILSLKPPSAPLRIGLIRPTGYQNVVIPIDDPNNYYHSRIQKGAEVQGSYLTFAASLKDDELVDLLLLDSARAGITLTSSGIWKDITTQLAAWVKAHPKGDSQRIWIKSVVLTRQVYSSESKVGAKAKDQVGDVVGVSGDVYRKSEDEQRSVVIAFEAFDVDELVAAYNSKSNLFDEELGPPKSARFTGVILGTLPATGP